jgi:glycosyltransferase involved in cell wall biosynthesis
MGSFAGYDLPQQLVMISTADWDAPLWTNKQQIASRLAGDFDVVYVEPVTTMGKGKRRLSKKVWTDACGVTVVRPIGTLPFGNKLSVINDANCALVAAGVLEVMQERRFSRPLLWCYPPTSYPLLKRIPFALSCYDCVDEYSAFPGTWITTMRNMEKKLLRAVDVVFTTAQSLYKDKRCHNPNTHFVPNVADFQLFHQAAQAKPPRRLQEMNRPVVGFVGALNYKIDAAFVEALLKLRPKWSFVFVGPDRGLKVDRFLSYPHAHFWGRKKPEELPAIMAGFDICMIPYVIDRYTQAVLPLKFFEYLATGKPVVATPMSELTRYQPLIDIAASPGDFVAAIERRLKKDPHGAERVALAEKNSWNHRIGQMLSILQTTYQEKREGGL